MGSGHPQPFYDRNTFERMCPDQADIDQAMERHFSREAIADRDRRRNKEVNGLIPLEAALEEKFRIVAFNGDK